MTSYAHSKRFGLLLTVIACVGCGTVEGISPDGGGPDVDSAPLPDPPDQAPRLIAPLAANLVTSQRPSLLWTEVERAESYEIDLCRDSDCSDLIATVSVTEVTGRPDDSLTRGAVFWRVRATNPGGAGPNSSTWHFFVGGRDAPVLSNWPQVFDPNGDGAPDVGVGTRAGQFHIFLTGAGSIPQLPSVSVTTAIEAMSKGGDLDGDGFGEVLIGTPLSSENVRVYSGTADGIDTDNPKVILAPSAGDGFGDSLAGVGDVNGDGYGDAVIGFDDSTGISFLYLGGPDGLASSPSGDPLLGSPVAAAGDVNGDGLADVLTCSRFSNEARVFHGNVSGMLTAALTIPAPAGTTGFGEACAGVGDVNGDGYADIIVAESAGRSGRVFSGGVSGIDGGTAVILAANAGGGAFNVTGHLGAAGDVNGDGIGDVFFGAYNATPPAIHVFAGDTTGVNTTALIQLVFDETGNYGTQAVGVGDLDGNGLDELVVGPSQCSGHEVVVTRGAQELVLEQWDGLGQCPGNSMAR